MKQQSPNRKLAAILSIDVVGYSRHMNEDETGTLAALKFCRANFIDPLVQVYHGRTFKLMGDGAMLEFGSVVSAVECAVEVQKQIEDCESRGSNYKSLQFRIGVNLGDVIVEGDDLFGDGVNVVSRIEALADPGGIAISGAAYDQVKNKLNLAFRNLGQQQLKNIKEPVMVYQVAGLNSELPETNAPHFSEKPSIAVLPFTSIGSDLEQEFFSEGISEDIITGLGKIEGLAVIAKSSTFTYKNKAIDIKQVSKEQGVKFVLEGSVRKSSNRIRVTAQLNNGITGQHIWAEKYDRVIDDIFDLQDELMREIVVALDVKLVEGEQAHRWSSGTKNVQAWECVRQSTAIILGTMSAQLPRARELLDQALNLDPNYAIAWVMLGWYHQNFVDIAGGTGFLDNAEQPLVEMKTCAEKAIQLDPGCADAYSLLAMHCMECGDFDGAEKHADKSIALAPANAENMMEAVVILVKTGNAEKALTLAKKAAKLCPILRPGFARAMALAYRFSGNLSAAAECLESAVMRQPDRLAAQVNLASVLGAMGRVNEAKIVAQQVLNLDSEFSINVYAQGLSYRNPDDLLQITEGLRAAGLPE